MKRSILCICAMVGVCALAEPAITIDRVQQRYPWNGKVDIDYTISEVDHPESYYVRFSVMTNGAEEAIVCRAFDDYDDLIEPADGSFRATWNGSVDAPMFAKGVTFTAELVYAPEGKSNTPYQLDYMIVDLSGGTAAERYPVSYLPLSVEDAVDYFNKDEYKTTKMVFRRVKAGTFMMGSPSTEPWHSAVKHETLHEVTLTKDFYIGIYEVTQKQYELVTGSNPSGHTGDARPVENVTVNTIRGDSGSVLKSPLTGTFLGTIAAKTGLAIDLPYEAQWEYACRAGTTSAYNNGTEVAVRYGDQSTADTNLNVIARNYFNANDGRGGYTDHTVVGCYEPNAWGLFDMIGNVWEWCRDGAEDGLGSNAVTDPTGNDAISARVGRGGSFKYGAWHDRSAVRTVENTFSYHDEVGFRVSMTVE